MALIFLFLVVAICILRYFESRMHLIALVDVVRCEPRTMRWQSRASLQVWYLASHQHPETIRRYSEFSNLLLDRLAFPTRAQLDCCSIVGECCICYQGKTSLTFEAWKLDKNMFGISNFTGGFSILPMPPPTLATHHGCP